MRNFSVQRSIATTSLSFCKRQYAGRLSAWVLLGIFTVLVHASDLSAQEELSSQEPETIPLTEPNKSSTGPGASKDNSSNSADASKDEESKDQPEYGDPPRELITQQKSDEYRKRSERSFTSAMRAGRRSAAST